MTTHTNSNHFISAFVEASLGNVTHWLTSFSQYIVCPLQPRLNRWESQQTAKTLSPDNVQKQQQRHTADANVAMVDLFQIFNPATE